MKLFSNDKRKQMKIFRVNVFFAIVHKSLLLLNHFIYRRKKHQNTVFRMNIFCGKAKKGLTTDCQSFVIDVYFVYIIYFLLLFVPNFHLFSSYRMNAKQIL